MVEKKSPKGLFPAIWDFFASVQLAIVTLCTISVVSIFGTIIPQNEAPEWYIKKFGPQVARFFDLFHLEDLYGSLWFKALLALLSANLIICSIDRLPRIWKQITADNLATPPKRLMAMKRNASWTVSGDPMAVTEKISGLLAKMGWKIQSRQTEDGTLLCSQKGAWTRLGVFMVHGSILVILVGAIIGSVLGFKGNVSIVEGESTNKVRINDTGNFLDLGFTVRCDGFSIDYYSNGMPKEYRSNLTVLENKRQILHKIIKVNTPLTYKGVTFYQSSYQAYNDFILSITNQETGKEKIFMAPYQKPLEWQKEGLRFGVINEDSAGEKVKRIKIWLSDASGTPSVLWLDTNGKATVKRGGKQYLILGQQLYATGLQVAKDPGVWWVYIGCALLLLGLFVSFFTSHRRVWLLLSVKGKKTSIYMAGSANKNKVGFDKIFSALSEKLKAAMDNQHTVS
jgi:cytochrome c biogenesis protein